ncbi:MAG: LptA/OstA family protein [Planctomycetota bacterium]
MRRLFPGLVFLVLAATPALAAEEEPAKGTLRLQADTIVFDRGKGEVHLTGKVRVVRTMGEQTVQIHCDKMQGEIEDGRLKNVEATGHVRLETKDLTATGARATFDFVKNVIHLFGTEDEWATATSEGMKNRGREIIFHIESQKVTLPKGGETLIDTSKKPEEGGD